MDALLDGTALQYFLKNYEVRRPRYNYMTKIVTGIVLTDTHLL